MPDLTGTPVEEDLFSIRYRRPPDTRFRQVVISTTIPILWSWGKPGYPVMN
jgi:hypothetical protein